MFLLLLWSQWISEDQWGGVDYIRQHFTRGLNFSQWLHLNCDTFPDFMRNCLRLRCSWKAGSLWTNSKSIGSPYGGGECYFNISPTQCSRSPTLFILFKQQCYFVLGRHISYSKENSLQCCILFQRCLRFFHCSNAKSELCA